MTEKAGRAQHSQNQMDGFRQIVNHCGFKDLGYYGPNYTWCNMKEGSNRTSLRLDRAFATNEWLEHFKDPTVHHLAESTSNHCILAITDSPLPSCRGKRHFHFEAMWVKREDCHGVIEAAWHSGTLSATPKRVASNLQICENALAS